MYHPSQSYKPYTQNFKTFGGKGVRIMADDNVELKRLQYVLILVDKWENYMENYQDDSLKIQWVRKGQSMRGFRFKHTRPTMIIDLIGERSLILREENRFEDWWKHCVVPQMTPYTVFVDAVKG